MPSQNASIIGLIWEYSVYLPCYSYHLYLFWDFWLSMWNGINLHYLGQQLLDLFHQYSIELAILFSKCIFNERLQCRRHENNNKLENNWIYLVKMHVR